MLRVFVRFDGFSMFFSRFSRWFHTGAHKNNKGRLCIFSLAVPHCGVLGTEGTPNKWRPTKTCGRFVHYGPVWHLACPTLWTYLFCWIGKYIIASSVEFCHQQIRIFTQQSDLTKPKAPTNITNCSQILQKNIKKSLSSQTSCFPFKTWLLHLLPRLLLRTTWSCEERIRNGHVELWSPQASQKFTNGP